MLINSRDKVKSKDNDNVECLKVIQLILRNKIHK